MEGDIAMRRLKERILFWHRERTRLQNDFFAGYPEIRYWMIDQGLVAINPSYIDKQTGKRRYEDYFVVVSRA